MRHPCHCPGSAGKVDNMSTVQLLAEQKRNIPLLDLSAQYLSIKQEIISAMDRVIQASDFILGTELELFESEFAAFCDAKHCVGVVSGLSALELVLRAWGIGPGDEVITAANTYIATALAISSTGATPVLVDVDPQSCNIDPDAVSAAITPKTRAIIPVHLYGLPADMDAINEIASRHDLAVLEDACQAHGARYKGVRAGALAHAAGCYSPRQTSIPRWLECYARAACTGLSRPPFRLLSDLAAEVQEYRVLMAPLCCEVAIQRFDETASRSSRDYGRPSLSHSNPSAAGLCRCRLSQG